MCGHWVLCTVSFVVSSCLDRDFFIYPEWISCMLFVERLFVLWHAVNVLIVYNSALVFPSCFTGPKVQVEVRGWNFLRSFFYMHTALLMDDAFFKFLRNMSVLFKDSCVISLINSSVYIFIGQLLICLNSYVSPGSCHVKQSLLIVFSKCPRDKIFPNPQAFSRSKQS